MSEKDLRVDEADGTDSTTGPDIIHGGGSPMANRDGRIEDQQLPAPNASTLTPGQGTGNPSK